MKRWLSELTPSWLVAVPLLALPLPLSAVVRAITGLSFQLSLPIAGAATVLLFVLLGQWSWDAEAKGGKPFLVAVATMLWCGGLLLYWMEGRAFSGMINTAYGVDFGNQADYYLMFTEVNPSAYFGFVSHFGVAWWVQRIFGGGVFDALRGSFYFVVCAVPFAMAVPIVVTYVERPRELEARRAVLVALAAVVALGTLEIAFIFFPLLSYHQSDGFLSHVFALLPVLLLFSAWTLAERRWQRLVLTILLIGLERYSHAENLGDLFAAAAILWGLELLPRGSGASRAWRIGWYVLVPVVALALFEVWSRLWSLRDQDGFFSYYEYGWILPLQLFASAVLLLEGPVLALVGATAGQASRRMFRFAGVLGLVNGLVQVAYLAASPIRKYYFYKYGWIAEVIVALGVLGFFCVLNLHAATVGYRKLARAHRRVLAWGGFCTLLSVTAVYNGLAIYYPAALERAIARPPFHQVRRAFDRDADRIITRVLDQTKRAFGGYFDPFWPRMYLMNVTRGEMRQGGYLDRAYDFYNRETLFREGAGECFFWQGPLSIYKAAKLPHAKQVESLMFRPGVKCETYRDPMVVPPDPGTPLPLQKNRSTLCYVCF